MSKLERDQFREEVNKLVKELRCTWVVSKLPYELYHYTDAKGLLGILTNKSFWATDINFLNDAMELKYASDLIAKILDAKIKGYDERLRESGEHSKVYLMLRSKTMNAYVTCFCEDGNLLSQWRAYAARGAGYSIGVVAESFAGDEMEGAGAPVGAHRLRKVIYSPEFQEHLVTETTNKFFDLLLSVLELSDEQDKRIMGNELANDLASELSEYLYCFKSPVFKEEQEWRIIHTNLNYHPYTSHDETLKLRASGGNIIPYIESRLADPPEHQLVARGYPISSIFYGPSLHPELTERSLNILLESTLGTGNGVNVINSHIPLRNTAS